MDDPVRSQLHLFLVAFATMAFTVTLYHCILVIWCNRGQQLETEHETSETARDDQLENLTSRVELIPTHKYQKGMNVEGEESVCPVCLSEFQDGEDLRTLPECRHSFHILCIDMWLYSHPNCPMCRTDATPSPCVLEVSNSDSQRPVTRETSTMQHDLDV